MFSHLLTLTSPPPSYDFDRLNPGIVIQQYLNDRLDDCVIAARAHHTLRLTYAFAGPTVNISPAEVSEEYHLENTGSEGVDLQTSLEKWKTDGWTAGGISKRRIKDYSGPLYVDGSGALSGDPTKDLNQTQVMSSIIESTCLQAHFVLPDGIRVDDKSTYGTGVLWQYQGDYQMTPHAMILTGYDEDGPLGITWGTKQKMTWEFLREYCVGIFEVVKDETT